MPSESNSAPRGLASLGEGAPLVPAHLALSVADVEAGDMELDPASPCVNALHHQLGFGYERAELHVRDLAPSSPQRPGRELIHLPARVAEYYSVSRQGNGVEAVLTISVGAPFVGPRRAARGEAALGYRRR